jgi:4-aminobutyrate aminotransferase-like enzyme
MVRSRHFLEIIEEDNLVQNSAQTGAYLLQLLHGLQREFPHLINNVRGKGTLTPRGIISLLFVRTRACRVVLRAWV